MALSRNYCKWCKGTGKLTLVTSIVDCTECTPPETVSGWGNDCELPSARQVRVPFSLSAPQPQSSAAIGTIGALSPAAQGTGLHPIKTTGPKPPSTPYPGKPVPPSSLALTVQQHLDVMLRFVRVHMPSMSVLVWDHKEMELDEAAGQVVFPIYDTTGAVDYYQAHVSAATVKDVAAHLIWRQRLTFGHAHRPKEKEVRDAVQAAIIKLESTKYQQNPQDCAYKSVGKNLILGCGGPLGRSTSSPLYIDMDEWRKIKWPSWPAVNAKIENLSAAVNW